MPKKKQNRLTAMQNGFLEALSENPNDVATRSAYADWLMEHGDLKAGTLQQWIAARITEGHEFDESENVDEQINQYIIDEGEVVYSLEWDSGGPGAGAGENKVCHWKGKFASSSDSGYEGPFDTLDEALESNSCLCVTTATYNIESSMLSAKEIAKRLECFANDGYVVQINGESWVYRAASKEFKRLRSKKKSEQEQESSETGPTYIGWNYHV